MHRRLSPPSSASRERRLGGTYRLLLAAIVGVIVLATAATVAGTGLLAEHASAAAAPTVRAAAAPAAVGCHPAAVLPWRCGTYRSTYGDKAVIGSTGGPKQDPLQMSLSSIGGRLVLHARAADCLAADVPMRLVTLSTRPVQRGLERAGPATISGHGCITPPAGSWVRAFLTGTIRSEYGEFFGRGTATVIFEYEGSAPIGHAQPLPRNDLKCVPSHVAPFSCVHYRSTAGTGQLVFLAARPFTLFFEHNNAELTAYLEGRCNALGASLALDGPQAVVTGVSSSAMGCTGQPQADDLRVSAFLQGVLTYRLHGTSITFTGPGSTATFAQTK